MELLINAVMFFLVIYVFIYVVAHLTFTSNYYIDTDDMKIKDYDEN